MSREQDMKLVEAYERMVKGEPPKLEEKRKKQFTKTLQRWFQTRLKNMKDSVKDLEDAIKEKSPNAILGSLTGVWSIMDVMKQAIEGVEMSEAVNPKDPSGERELFINQVSNLAAQYLQYGVINRQEYNKIKDFMRKTIKF